MKHSIFQWSISFLIVSFLYGTIGVIAQETSRSLQKSSPKTPNPLLGEWESPCRYLGGNEYMREVLEFKGPKKVNKKDKLEGTVWRRFVNFQDADCASPSLRVSNKYEYTIKSASSLAEGTNYNLELKNTKVLSYMEEVTETMKEVCHKKKKDKLNNLKTNKERQFKEILCGDLVEYPGKKEKYYDIIRLVNNQLSLGDNSEATKKADRPTEYAAYGFLPVNQ